MRSFVIGVIVYIFAALPVGWYFFQQPKESATMQRLSILDVWFFGLLSPIILLAVLIHKISDQRRRPGGD